MAAGEKLGRNDIGRCAIVILPAKDHVQVDASSSNSQRSHASEGERVIWSNVQVSVIHTSHIYVNHWS